MTQPEATMRSFALALLEEVFEQRAKGGNYILDSGTGWFHTLDALPAEDASRRLVEGGSTVAGHTFHTTFYLNLNLRDSRGEDVGKVDWAASWAVSNVDAAAWDGLRADLRAAYQEVTALLGRAERWGQAEADLAMCAVTHSAYHLGAVRQFLTVLRGEAGAGGGR